MMVSPQQLKKLQTKWYRKLKAVGFHDIEWGNGSGYLKDRLDEGSFDLDKPLPTRYSSKDTHHAATGAIWKESYADYYRFASQCLHDKTFPSKSYKRVWQLHCEGVSFTAIGKEMGLHRDTIADRIKRLRLEFGLLWPPRPKDKKQ